jgi:hypothetical protein
MCKLDVLKAYGIQLKRNESFISKLFRQLFERPPPIHPVNNNNNNNSNATTAAITTQTVLIEETTTTAAASSAADHPSGAEAKQASSADKQDTISIISKINLRLIEHGQHQHRCCSSESADLSSTTCCSSQCSAAAAAAVAKDNVNKNKISSNNNKPDEKDSCSAEADDEESVAPASTAVAEATMEIIMLQSGGSGDSIIRQQPSESDSIEIRVIDAVDQTVIINDSKL